MKYNLFYLSGGGKKALLLVLSLFFQISLFAGWSLREKNNRTKFCCDEEYEFIFDANDCTCQDASGKDLPITESMIKTKPASLILNSLTSLGNRIYSFKVKFDCESAKIIGQEFSIDIICSRKNLSNCTITFKTTSVRPKLNLQNIIQKIDCGKADAFKLKLPTGNYPPDLVTLEFAYSPGLSGPAAGNPNEDIYVTPETGTTTGTVTVTAKDIYCDQTSSATVAIERNPPPAPGIPRPSGQDPNCPSSIWCYNSQNGISIEIPQVPGAVDYELTNSCGLNLTKDPNNVSKFILSGQITGSIPCIICVRAKNICNIWSEEVCYSIVITTERPLAPQLILDDPNLAWWICCPTLEIPGGVFQVGSNSCSNLVEIIGNDGKIMSSSNALRIGGAIGSEQANNGNTYTDNVCNPFVYTSFTVKITSSNCFGNTTSSYGFNTLPYGDSRCPNQQLKTGRGKSDIEIEVKEIDAENYLIKTNAGQGNTIHLYTMDGATLLESKNKEVLVKKSLVKDKIILIQASDNEASSSKKYFFGN